MNLSRTILDGIVLSILFNAVVGLFFFVVPQAYAMMFPKSIKESAKPYVTRYLLDIYVLSANWFDCSRNSRFTLI